MYIRTEKQLIHIVKKLRCIYTVHKTLNIKKY